MISDSHIIFKFDKILFYTKKITSREKPTNFDSTYPEPWRLAGIWAQHASMWKCILY